MVNQDPDMALSVKVGMNHAELSDFSNVNTIKQKSLTSNELGKGSQTLAKKKGKRKAYTKSG